MRGTKADLRDRHAPLVSDEARILIGFARDHANGADGRLFSKWGSMRRDLGEACARAGIPKITPHPLRQSYARWMIELAASRSVIAPLLGPRDSRMVERIYGKMKAPDAVPALMLALGPKHASRAHAAAGAESVQTLTKGTPGGHLVAGVYTTLTQSSEESGIPKSTLLARVARGLSMEAAFMIGRGTKGRLLSSGSATVVCRTRPAETSDAGAPIGQRTKGSRPPTPPIRLICRLFRCPGTELNCRHADFQSQDPQTNVTNRHDFEIGNAPSAPVASDGAPTSPPKSSLLGDLAKLVERAVAAGDLNLARALIDAQGKASPSTDATVIDLAGERARRGSS
jgi:hypothetical protein